MKTSCNHFKKRYLPMLQKVIEFLSSVWLMEWFVVNCLQGGQTSEFAHLFKPFDISLAEWRWFSLMFCIFFLLDRILPLRLYFKASNMNYKPEETVQGSKKSLDDERAAAMNLIGKMHAAIASPFFWSSSLMLRLAGKSIMDLEQLFVSCPCHPRRFKFWADRMAQSKSIRDRKGTTLHCAMCSRMLPNIAAGE